MAQHVLSLEVPDTRNTCILRIVDTSVYNSDVSIVCPVLLITIPGFSYSVQYTMSVEPGGSNVVITPGFILNLTACDLEIQSSGCGTTYSDLPDGIYAIKYSVSPNEYVYVEYNHLRITKALNRIQAILCDLDVGACDPPLEIDAKFKKLEQIRMFLDAAKARVEYCHNAGEGMMLYNYAITLLNKIECKTC